MFLSSLETIFSKPQHKVEISTDKTIRNSLPPMSSSDEENPRFSRRRCRRRRPTRTSLQPSVLQRSIPTATTSNITYESNSKDESKPRRTQKRKRKRSTYEAGKEWFDQLASPESCIKTDCITTFPDGDGASPEISKRLNFTTPSESVYEENATSTFILNSQNAVPNPQSKPWTNEYIAVQPVKTVEDHKGESLPIESQEEFLTSSFQSTADYLDPFTETNLQPESIGPRQPKPTVSSKTRQAKGELNEPGNHVSPMSPRGVTSSASDNIGGPTLISTTVQSSSTNMTISCITSASDSESCSKTSDGGCERAIQCQMDWVPAASSQKQKSPRFYGSRPKLLPNGVIKGVTPDKTEEIFQAIMGRPSKGGPSLFPSVSTQAKSVQIDQLKMDEKQGCDHETVKIARAPPDPFSLPGPGYLREQQDIPMEESPTKMCQPTVMTTKTISTSEFQQQPVISDDEQVITMSSKSDSDNSSSAEHNLSKPFQPTLNTAKSIPLKKNIHQSLQPDTCLSPSTPEVSPFAHTDSNKHQSAAPSKASEANSVFSDHTDDHSPDGHVTRSELHHERNSNENSKSYEISSVVADHDHQWFQLDDRGTINSRINVISATTSISKTTDTLGSSHHRTKTNTLRSTKKCSPRNLRRKCNVPTDSLSLLFSNCQSKEEDVSSTQSTNTACTDVKDRESKPVKNASTWKRSPQPSNTFIPRCGVCVACLVAYNCKKCIFCLDMRIYGGKEQLGQLCIYRQCLTPTPNTDKTNNTANLQPVNDSARATKLKPAEASLPSPDAFKNPSSSFDTLPTSATATSRFGNTPPKNIENTDGIASLSDHNSLDEMSDLEWGDDCPPIQPLTFFVIRGDL